MVALFPLSLSSCAILFLDKCTPSCGILLRGVKYSVPRPHLCGSVWSWSQEKQGPKRNTLRERGDERDEGPKERSRPTTDCKITAQGEGRLRKLFPWELGGTERESGRVNGGRYGINVTKGICWRSGCHPQWMCRVLQEMEDGRK